VKTWGQKSINSLLDSYKHVGVEEKSAHALQRIIEQLLEAKIFDSKDSKWGHMYWRTLLKQHTLKYKKSYEQLESEIGVWGEYGLLKELKDVPSKYPKYGWLRNKLK